MKERTELQEIERGLRVRGLWRVAVRVAKSRNMTVADILGRKQCQSVRRARTVLYLALVDAAPQMSLSEIAGLLRRDYSTIHKCVQAARAPKEAKVTKVQAA